MQIYTRSEAYCAGQRENNLNEIIKMLPINVKVNTSIFNFDSEDLALFAIFQTINLNDFFSASDPKASIYQFSSSA